MIIPEGYEVTRGCSTLYAGAEIDDALARELGIPFPAVDLTPTKATKAAPTSETGNGN